MRARLPNEFEALEALVDGIGLQQTIEALQEICELKADHIRENWDDRVTARFWDKRAKVLYAAAGKVGND